MINGNVCGEGQGRACSCCNCSRSTAGTATNVASQVIGGKIRDWRVVVRVLANVLVDCALYAVGGQHLEDVCTGLLASGFRVNTFVL